MMKKKISNEVGAIAIEFAIIAPIIAFMGLGIFEFCRCMWYQNELVQILNTGAHYIFSQPKDFSGVVDIMQTSSIFKDDPNYVVQQAQCACANTASDTMDWLSCTTIDCSDYSREYVKMSVQYNNFQHMFAAFSSIIPTGLVEETIVRIK